MSSCGCYRLKTCASHQHYATPEEVPYSAVNKGLVDHTTSHGLPHIAVANGLCKKAFWFVLTIAMVFFWIGNTYFILQEYIKYDVNVKIDIKNSRFLEFPAVTVCNQNSLRETALTADTSVNGSYQTAQGQTKYDPGASSGNQQDGLGNSLDTRHQNTDLLTEIVAGYTTAQKKALGHQSEDFILTCDFAGYECDRASLNHFYNWLYGNCYTFNSGSDSNVKNLNSSKTGPLGGLQMTLNIEQDEYLEDITYKAGARVLVHYQEDFPFPESEGSDISPGKATAVGIRKVDIERKGGRYGTCVDTTVSNKEINVYEEKQTWTRYTQKACDNTCMQKEIISTCSCYDTSYPSTGSAFSDQSSSPCKSTDETQATCKFNVEESYENSSLTCDCPKPCSTNYYEVSISSSEWPSLNYKNALKLELNGISTTADAVITADKMSDNFAFLEVYYEEMNYQLMQEDAAYEDSQFVADFGGAIGLWVGASMITIFEFGEYLLDMLILCCARCCSNKRTNSKISTEKRPHGKAVPPNANKQRYPGELRTVNEKFNHR